MNKKQEIQSVLTELQLSVISSFVPYSISRNFKEDYKLSDMNLNFNVAVKHKDACIMRTEYSMGQGHCPSYVQGERSMDYAADIKFECEHGVAAGANKEKKVKKGAWILADVVDIFYGIVSDSEADDQSFEEWCSNFGYDADSRKAEAIYQVCREQGRALRIAIGAAGLQRLRDAYQDY